MAYSVVYTTATGTATTTTIAASVVTFSYLKKSHLEVRISGAGDTTAAFKTALGLDSITALVQGLSLIHI